MENIITTNENTNPTEETKKTPLKMIIKPNPFAPVADITFTTTTEIAKMINNCFKSAFADYYGCAITVQFNQAIGQFVILPVLHFRLLTNEAYLNADENTSFGFMPLEMNKESGMIGRVQRLSNSSTGPKVSMTDDLKSVLSDFIIGNPAKVDWNQNFNTSVMGGNTFIRAYKLDILKFLKALYGSHDVNGGELYYQPSVIRSITSANIQQYSATDNWSVSIMRLNEANEKYAAEQQGIIMNPIDAPAAVVRA